jgi:N-acetylneuraminate lyase
MNLLAATYAPMKEDFSLNPNIISTYGAFLKSNSIKGAFINGSTGDFVSLSTKERMQLMDAWSGQRSENFKVINHVGHTSIIQAIKLAKHSAILADGIAVIAPYYFTIKSASKLVAYCKEIAAAAPELPFYYYHIPVLSGANIAMRNFVASAVEEIPNFQGVKFTHNDMVDFQFCIELKDKVKPELEFYFGIDEMFVNSISLGGHGWVGSTYNHLAPLYRKIHECHKIQDYQQANELQRRAVRFVETLDAFGGFNGAGKSYMKTLGIDCGPSRSPHITLTEAQLDQAKDQMKSIQLSPEDFTQ